MALGLSEDTLLPGILATCLLIAYVTRALLAGLLHHLSAKGRTMGPLLASHLSTVAAAFLGFGALLILMPLAGIPDESPILAQAKQVIFILLTTWLAIRLITFLEAATYQQLDVAKPDNLEERKLVTQIKYIRATLIIVVAVVGFALTLMTFEDVRRLGAGILASAGIASVVIAFGAQKLITNILAGFQIAFTQPIRLDDAVVVENEWGWVEEITLTYVVVRIWDQRRLVLPITYFIEHPFQNWTRTSADLLGSVYLYVDYSVPVDAIRGELDRILEDTPLWDGKTKVVHVTDATEKSMQVRILASAKNSPHAWELRCLIREKLIAYLQKEYPDGLPKHRGQLQGETANKQPPTKP